jgi:IS5 family transposase
MMWRKEQKQLSLADGLVVRRKGQNEQLDRIGELLNWGGLERLLGGVYGAGEGRPAYRPLVMFKAVASPKKIDSPFAPCSPRRG